MMDGMGMMIWGLVSFLLGLLVIFLFILGLAIAVKWVWGKTAFTMTGTGESALDLLKKRYAKGEIGKEEFERIRKDIE